MKIKLLLLLSISLQSFKLFSDENGNIFNKRHVSLEEIAGQSSSGSDIGGGNLNVGHIATWCSDAIMVLEDALEAADLALLYSSSYYRANVILSDAFESALNDMAPPPQSTTFTLKAIEQGKTLILRMGAKNPEMTELESEALFTFLKQYIHFITNTIYRDLDKRFYFPYVREGHGSCHDCYSEIEAFEHRFIKYASEQLQLFVNYFVSPEKLAPNGEIVVITPRLFLKGLESLSLAVAETIDESFWQEALSCSSTKLKAVNRQLQQFNAGDRSRYPTERLAIYFIHKKIKKIILDIGEC